MTVETLLNCGTSGDLAPVLPEVDSVDAAHDAALGEELEHLLGGGGEWQTSGLDHASLGHFDGF